MANINVSDLAGLNPTGADLFDDPESFMVELSDEENGAILGGRKSICPADCSLCTQGITIDCGQTIVQK